MTDGNTTTCGDCTAFHAAEPTGRFGQCRANPPTPILIGTRPTPDGSGLLPLIDAFYPPTGVASFGCRDGFVQRLAGGEGA